MCNCKIIFQVGGSVFYYNEPAIECTGSLSGVEALDKEINLSKEAALLETKLSSLVWICTSTHSASIVTVIDANNPAEILNSFGICTNLLLCIASVPGANPSDYDNKRETFVSIDDNHDDVVERKDVKDKEDVHEIGENMKCDNNAEKDKSQSNVRILHIIQFLIIYFPIHTNRQFASKTNNIAIPDLESHIRREQ